MPDNFLPTSYQEFIHLSRYSRWLPEEGRRETWNETVTRYFDFFTDHVKDMTGFKIDKDFCEICFFGSFELPFLLNTIIPQSLVKSFSNNIIESFINKVQ